MFEGGFLGLTTRPIDRSHLPAGNLEQSDATGWMGFYATPWGYGYREPVRFAPAEI